MRLAVRCMPIAVALLATATSAFASDIEEAGFGLRLAAAQTRFARYPDSAGLGGAGAGSPWSSSPNPASTGMSPAVGPRRWGASAQYSLISFEAGTLVNVASLSGSRETESWGCWQPSVFGLTSNRATTNDGLDFEWEALSAEVQWGKKISSATSVGVNVNYLGSEMDFDLGATDVTTSTADTWGLRLGVLHKATEKLYVGFALDGQYTPSRTTTYDFMGLGVGTVRESDTAWALLGRTGIYTFLTDDLTLYADYQLGYFTDDSGTLITHRIFAGLDQTIIRGLYARVGTVLDVEGNVSLAAGIGLAPSERFLIDLSYQYDMFPEIDPEFGRGDTFGLGISVLF